jgi:hypothetical protein
MHVADKKFIALTKMAATLNAKKTKDEAKDAAPTKTRKVGKAKVKSKVPAKAGGVVFDQIGEGYIFADEPDKIYVVGTGWFGSWELKDIEYREPGAKVNIPKFVPEKADIYIGDINAWNSIGSALVSPVRTLKNNMANNSFTDYAKPYSAGLTVESYGQDENGVWTGVWHRDDGVDKTWAVVASMWNIL